MRNVVLLHKWEGLYIAEMYVDVDRIVAVGNPTDNKRFEIIFENEITWLIDGNDYELLMSAWASSYKYADNKCFNLHYDKTRILFYKRRYKCYKEHRRKGTAS